MNRPVVVLVAFILTTIMFAGCLEDNTVKLQGDDLSQDLGVGNATSSGGSSGNGGGGDDGSGSSEGGGAKKVTIVFWHTFEHNKEKEVLNDVIADFEKEHPNIHVDVQSVPYDGAIEKFTTAAQGGEAPDVMRVPNDRLGSLAFSGYVEPLDQFISVSQKETYMDIALDAMKYNGKIYALPASYDCMALIYNKDMLNSYGYDAPPQTLDEMVTMAKAMTRGDNYGLVFPIIDPYWWFPFQYAFGGQIFDEDNNPTIYSQASVNATDFLIGLETKEGIIPEGGVDKVTMMQLFTEGKAGMIITGPWNLEDIKAAEINYGIAPLPENPDTGRYAAPLVGAKGYVISKSSEHKPESYELIKYLTSAEVTERFALVSNTLPSVKSVYTSEDIVANSDIQGFLQQAKNGQQMPTIPEMSAVWGPLTSALQAVYSGDKTSDAALKDAQKEIEDQINM